MRSSAGVFEFAPMAGGTCTVVTSTERAFTAQGVPVEVGGFSREESVGYLRERTGRVDDVGARLVAVEVGDSPLGLAQAAAVLAARPGVSYGEFATRLRERPLARMLPAERGAHYPRGVAEAILQSVGVAEDADPPG